LRSGRTAGIALALAIVVIGATDLSAHRRDELLQAARIGVAADRIDLASAKARDAQRTWAYARRQRTWFRSEPDIAWLPAGEGSAGRALRILAPFLGRIGRADYAGQP
jgi:tRNA A37 N6-isopentenylltransferase MiaA